MIQVKDPQIFEDYKAKKSTNLPDYSNNIPTFQGFLLKDNNEKKSESHAGQKINCIRDEEQKMPILCTDQKVDVREEKHPASKAQKSWKVIFTTYINIENKPKNLHSYVGKLANNAIRE